MLRSAFVSEPEDVHAFAETESGLLANLEEPCAFGCERGGGNSLWHEEDAVRGWGDAFASDGFEECMDVVEVCLCGDDKYQLVFTVAHPSGES